MQLRVDVTSVYLKRVQILIVSTKSWSDHTNLETNLGSLKGKREEKISKW